MNSLNDNNLNPDKHSGHVIVNLEFGNRGAIRYLSDKIRTSMGDGNKVFKIRPKPPKGRRYPDLGPLYPNACVPIAGALDYFRTEFGCTFISSRQYDDHPVLAASGIVEPYEFGTEKVPRSAINCVWKFTPETHSDVVDSIVDEMRRSGDMGQNVLLGLELALNEVTDNIIQHSLPTSDTDDSIGYVMAQFHKSSNRIAVAVYDYGQGIPSSLGKGRYVGSPQEAISDALQKGVTGGNGAGNGLWMMSQIVRESSGQFEIQSDGVMYNITHERKDSAPYKIHSYIAPIKEGTTFIDFQMTSKDDFDIYAALDNYEPTDLWFEKHLDDSSERIVFSVKEESKGTRSRRAAANFARLVLNTLKGRSEKCVIDFENSPNLSASYADELILSMVEDLGFYGFMKTVDLINLSQFNRAMIDGCMRGRFERK